MEPVANTFREQFTTQGRDIAPLADFLEHMPIVVVEDNGEVGEISHHRTPLLLHVEFHAAGQEAINVMASLTLDEATQLRNILNRAIVWAEGVLAA